MNTRPDIAQGTRNQRYRPVAAAHCAMPDDAVIGHTSLWLSVQPRDTMLVRDGRAFDAGFDAIAEPVDPWPSTAAGAVAAAYGVEPCAVRGPLLLDTSNEQSRLYFAPPADLVRTQDVRPDVARLRPEPATAFTDLDAGPGMSWLQSPFESAGDALHGVISGDRLACYLAGELPAAGERIPQDGLELRDDPQPREVRVGLARENRTARTGFLYQAAHIRLMEHWYYAVQVAIPPGWCNVLDGPVPFGGRSRFADVIRAPTLTWPQAPSAFPDGRVLVYVATPGIWPDGWQLPVPEGARLVAAAVRETAPVAMASPRDGVAATRTLYWSVPAGSVYLLSFADSETARDWAARAHGRALGPATNDRLRTAGFGVILTGVW